MGPLFRFRREPLSKLGSQRHKRNYRKPPYRFAPLLSSTSVLTRKRCWQWRNGATLRPRDPTQLHRRGLHLLRVVHLRDGRSLPHLRWLRPYRGVAGARATPHSRLPQLEASAPNGNRSRCRGMKKPGAVPATRPRRKSVVLKLYLARPQ